MRLVALVVLTIFTCLPDLATAQQALKAGDDPKAVAALRKMGVTLVHEGGRPERPVVAVTISRSTVEEIDEALSLLAKLPQVRELTLSGTSLTSSDRKHLQSLTAIHTLRLVSMVVGKKDLEALDALKELRSLDLADSVLDWRASDGLSYARRRELRVLKLGGSLRRDQRFDLAGFTQLQHLVLKSPRIESWLGGISVLADLETLALIDTAKEEEPDNPRVAWTGVGLGKLKGLKKLKELNVRFSAPIDDRDKWWKPLLELTQIEDLTLGLAQILGSRDNIDFLANLKDMTRLRRLSIDAGSHEINLHRYERVSFPKTVREIRFISGVVNRDSLDALRERQPELRISGTINRIVHDRETFIQYGHRNR